MAYFMLMKSVIVELVKTADPSIKFENEDVIKEAVSASHEMTRKVYAFIEIAENISRTEDSNGNLSDLIYIKIADLQEAVDAESPSSDATQAKVFEEYINQILEGLPEAQFSLQHDMIITSSPDMHYLKLVIKLIRETPPNHIEMFLWWTTIEELLTYTTSDMRQLYYSYMKIMGFDVGFERSTLCASAINKLMGYSVSSLVVDEDFLSEIQPRVQRMVKNIQNSFEYLVEKSNWMDDETKIRTLKKSSKIKTLIGFPEWILDNEKLDDFYKGVSF